MSLSDMMKDRDNDIYVDKYTLIESDAEQGIWRSAKGQMNIQDMKAGHIKNCIACLEDYRIDYGEYLNNLWIKTFEQELERRLK